MNYIRTSRELYRDMRENVDLISSRDEWLYVNRPKKNNHDPSPHVSEIEKTYRPVSTIARAVL